MKYVPQVRIPPLVVNIAKLEYEFRNYLFILLFHNSYVQI